MIPEITWKERTVFLFCCTISILIVIFCVAGVYQTFWSIPAKKAAIGELTLKVNIWESKAKKLDKYIIEQDHKYRVATKFDNLFILIADPDQVMDFEALDGYIKERKEFYRTKTDGINE